MQPKVFFTPTKTIQPAVISQIAHKLLKTLIEAEQIKLQKEIPLKVHPGNPGNITFIKPANFSLIIKFLQEKKIKTYYVETNQAPMGSRANKKDHLAIAKQHGFTQLPFVVADNDGFDHILVKIQQTKHFRECKIARQLAQASQVIVLSHFKGHCMAGFGGAIKMLAFGFASGRGKLEIHSRLNLPYQAAINWSKTETLYQGQEFRERSAEYALAASQNKNLLYLNFALNLTENCDCDERVMKPLYQNLGVLASTDPVAIDKACFDLLTKREGKKPFTGEDIFTYAQQIGLGSQNYQLVKI